MRIVICFLLMVVVTCSGCDEAGTINSTSQTRTEKPINIFNSVNVTDTKSISNKNAEIPIDLPEIYFGRWGGTGGGLFEINKLALHNVLNDKTYPYVLIEVRKVDENNQYLLKLLDDPEDGYIKKFILLKFVNENHLYYFGYDTYGDSLKNNYSGAGEFFKATSEK